MIFGKTWGKTSPIFSKNNVEIHRIEVKKGGYCSKHLHEKKFNAFFLESGSLEVLIWKNDYNLCDATFLEPGQMTVVTPGEYHLFKALEDSVVYEIYWVELEAGDIVRKSVGGWDERSART